MNGLLYLFIISGISEKKYKTASLDRLLANMFLQTELLSQKPRALNQDFTKTVT